MSDLPPAGASHDDARPPGSAPGARVDSSASDYEQAEGRLSPHG